MTEVKINAAVFDSFRKYLQISEKSRNTIDKYIRDVKAFGVFIQGEPVSKELAIAFKEKLLGDSYAVRSINSIIASLNSFFAFAGCECCRIKNIKEQRQIFCPEEKELTQAEYNRLLSAAENKGNKRLNLILQTICGTGIRVSELKFITVEAVKRGEDDIRTGYFPFNNTDTNGSSNNLGFATKFEMKFKLNKNGTVSALDSNGEKSTDGKLHTMFEFQGDDDLWVFLDGKLLLDLGGSHDQTSGLIDFYEKKAYANKALTLGDHAAGDDPDKDDLGAPVGIKTVQPAEFVTKLAAGSYDSDTGEYDPYYTHTMTIFYMERGMMDSNLMIRFNYKPESHFSKMKVQEVTDFSAVNAGLLDLTQKAADSDVFQYSLKNKGTAAADSLFTGILYPTYDTY